MTTARSAPPSARPWALLGVRLGAVALATAAMWVVASTAFDEPAFPPNTIWATLGLLPANLLCLIYVRRLYHRMGIDLRTALGVRRGRVGRDILWGFTWLAVLYIPFALAVAGTVFAIYGAEAPAAFETIFFDPAAAQHQDPALLLAIAVLAVVPFMVINAPTEELVFRGYALAGIERRAGAGPAIAVTSVLFGAQHILFAPTVPAMVVFFVAFTVWGAIAAVIVRRQGRLLPIVIAHWVVNIALSAPAIAIPVLQLSGVALTG